VSRASLIRDVFSQTFPAAFASIRFAGWATVGQRMSLFPGSSGHSEPPLGRQAGAASHLQAAVPTLLQALSSSESTAPRPVGEASLAPPACVALAGWLAEAGRRLGQPAACCGTDSGLRSADRGPSCLALATGDRSGSARAATCHLPTCLAAHYLPACPLPAAYRLPPQVPQLIIESASPCKILLANHAWCALRIRYASEDLALTPTLPLPLALTLTRCALTGYASEDVVGRSASLLHGPLTCRETLSALGIAMASGRSLQVARYRSRGCNH